MTIQLGVVMDPISTIHFEKDSTLAMLWEAKRRGWIIHYFEQSNLFIRDGKALGRGRLLNVFHDASHWFELGAEKENELSECDIILMRKDPPFDLNYIYTTYVLELAEHAGVKVINKPQSLRDFNEKMATMWFPACCPPTVVTSDIALLHAFFETHSDIVCKPLDGMGGASIFRLRYPDDNASVIMETLTQSGTRFMMAQRYIPEIVEGDKRILMIDGQPVPYALARVPGDRDWRGNLAVGARGVAKPLTEKDRSICEEVGPILREKGLFFVGLDVIGNYLTEINVTSPTCIRELDEQCQLNIAKTLMDEIEKVIQHS